MLVLALVLAVGGYVLYLQTGYYRIPDGEVLAVENPQAGQLAPGQDYTALTYNIGFGAYGPDYSFFMDTGTMADGTPVQGRWGKAKSKDAVLANTQGALETIAAQNADFLLLQEVDVDAHRSYQVDQRAMLRDGLPGYGEMDITEFVAITYTLLFGMMFGDVGQGAVLAIAAFIIYKWKHRALFKLVVPCGISSMCFGFVFGSVFGFEEALDPLYHALGWAGKPIEVMDSINTVLLMAIGIGVALVAIAILLNFVASARKKLWGEMIFSNNGIVGLLVYLSGVNLVSAFMGGPSPVPGPVCGLVIGVGLVLLFLKEVLVGLVDHHPNWKPESWVDYSMQNIFELLEYVLSYFSNTVSFLRVGAFVIVHAAMMLVVFSLAGEPANPIVVVLGNALVICLEGLLSGIQGLRLEFYEMFSRCYEGGGRPFRGVKLAPAKPKAE